MINIDVDKLIPIERFLFDREADKEAPFRSIIRDITFAVKLIAFEIRRAGLNDILGLTEKVNIHGEQIKKIDQYANDAIISAMENNGNVAAMISEESNGVIQMKNSKPDAKYILAFDPLDGSTNMEANITIGSIFSIYERLEPKEPVGDKDFLQGGRKQIAAAYALYGGSVTFVYTSGAGVNVFVYDPAIGELLLTRENLKMPKKGRQYSCNEANSLRWSDGINDYIKMMKNPKLNGGVKYISRYVATVVADVHRILHYGGVYLYPSENSLPNGKIRIAYEANPLAMIVEQAGGSAWNGAENILDIKMEKIHQTCPFYIGSMENIQELKEYYRD
jgi:fructose-1,6-bisphosphatase I